MYVRVAGGQGKEATQINEFIRVNLFLNRGEKNEEKVSGNVTLGYAESPLCSVSATVPCAIARPFLGKGGDYTENPPKMQLN